MQYYRNEWNLAAGGKVVKVYIHETLLSYSWRKYYVSSLTITTQDVIRVIASAIEYFGGFSEKLIIDNPRQMIITQSYRARTKGKVERPFYFLQEHLS